MADDKMLREMTSDPKFRKVLVTDGKTEVGQALVKALVKAGAEIVWVGHAEPWKKLPGLRRHHGAAAGDAGAARPHRRPLGRASSPARSAARSTSSSTTPRCIAPSASPRGAAPTSPRPRWTSTTSACCAWRRSSARRCKARSADGATHAAAWVNLLSVYALSNYPPHGTFSASKAAAHSLAQCLRAEMRPAGIRVVNVFPGPIDDEWNQNLPPPKVAPAALASAIVKALKEGIEDVYPGRRRAGVARALAREPEGARARARRRRLRSSDAARARGVTRSARRPGAAPRAGSSSPALAPNARLMTCSIKVGSSTGSSAGFAPRNTRSMKDASRR